MELLCLLVIKEQSLLLVYPLVTLFHIPKLSLNLLFVGQLCELGIDLLFTNHGMDVQDPRTGQVLGTGRKVGRMFEVHDLKITSQVVSAAATTATPSPDLWHARLGHLSLSRLQLLTFQGHLGSVQFQKFDCTSYHFGKQTKLPFNNSDSFSSAPFDLIHFDIWGPTPVPTKGGSKYFVILGFICFTIGLNLRLFTKHFVK